MKMSAERNRILFCCPTPLRPTLGASKVYIEVAAGFRRLGWDVSLLGPDEVAGGRSVDPHFEQPDYLRSYLRKHAGEYAVIEYEHYALPFPRADFPTATLFVARSVLTVHAHLEADIPAYPTWRSRLRHLIWGPGGRRWPKRMVPQADRTLGTADLINVSNTYDAITLSRHGHAADKIVVFPYGLFEERSDAFRPAPDAIPDPPVIAFVGSFDPRKGMVDLPRVATAVMREFPRAIFRLIGTAGLVATAERVLSFFPRGVRPHIQVTPRFEPRELPELLSGCTLGVFPSRLESFGFGVLEMLAAGLPVIAYDVPGPPMMLPQEYLVRRGDASAMAEKIVTLLGDGQRLTDARRWARRRSQDFRWEDIVRRTAETYQQRLDLRRGAAEPVARPA